MRVVINYITMNLQENDEVEVQSHECGRCGANHTEVTVTRDNKRIAHFGEYVRLSKRVEEYFGDVIAPKR